MSKIKIFRWWAYASFLKLFGVMLLAVLLSALSVMMLPNIYCLLLVFPICGFAGYLGRCLFPEVYRDFVKELER